MSFSSEVKKELLDISDLEKNNYKSFLLGIFSTLAEIRIANQKQSLVLKSPIAPLFSTLIPLLKELYHLDNLTLLSSNDTLNKRRVFRLEIEDAEKLIEEYSLYPFYELSIDHKYLDDEAKKRAFVRGAFVSHGSINDPRKSCYHLEIAFSNYNVAEIAQNIMYEANITALIIERRDKQVLYIKHSESISDCLALMGADSGVFYFEDQRILRDISNMANRMTNCDIANEIKCANICKEQLAAIDKIRKKGKFNDMSVRLQTTAKLREEYPDSSYEELAMFSDNLFGKKLSKSGISHCLQDLMSYAKSI